MFRTARLERDVDRAIDQWLKTLARWDPISGRRRRTQCEACGRLAAELEFDDVPHSVLHALMAPVSAIIDDCFERAAGARYPQRTTRATGRSSADAVPLPDVIAPEAQESVEIDLAVLYGRIHGKAVLRIAAQRTAITWALAVHVEPKIQSLADQLLIEIGA